MSLNDPRTDLFPALAALVTPGAAASRRAANSLTPIQASDAAAAALERVLAPPGAERKAADARRPLRVVVIDEMDQLLNR